MALQVKLLQAQQQMQRRIRSPRHTFEIRSRPWQIVPFLIAPVLPGETLKNIQHQARVVTDPLKSKLIGFWHETYYFYVKHRDLDHRDALVNMHLTGASLSATNAAAIDVNYYTPKNGQTWVATCLKRVVEEYFRDEDETWNADLIPAATGYPVASVARNTWIDSLIDDTAAPPAANILQDGNVEEDTVIAAYQAQYDRMRQMRFTDMTFDDWLKVQGISGVQMDIPEDSYKPELLRYDREWTYPVNHVEPTTGAPTSACVWSINTRADKDRFFKEPGFIFGVQCTRPKIYFSKQTGNASAVLDEARLWLPAMLRDEPYTSVAQFVTGASSDGPLGANPTNGYWVDMRDLFLYGDQFINFALTETDAGLVALPKANLAKRYATAADADAFFFAAAPANQIRLDGVADLHIAGKVGPDQT